MKTLDSFIYDDYIFKLEQSEGLIGLFDNKSKWIVIEHIKGGKYHNSCNDNEWKTLKHIKSTIDDLKGILKKPELLNFFLSEEFVNNFKIFNTNSIVKYTFDDYALSINIYHYRGIKYDIVFLDNHYNKVSNIELLYYDGGKCEIIINYGHSQTSRIENLVNVGYYNYVYLFEIAYCFYLHCNKSLHDPLGFKLIDNFTENFKNI